MRRWIVSGTPGAGKTSLVEALAARGHAVVREAATDVVASYPDEDGQGGRGVLDAIVAVQRERELAAPPAGTTHQVFDRSPLCTLALARHMGWPVTPALEAEVKRVVREAVFERQVLYVEWLGFLTPTSVRRIDVPDTISFDRIHREVYAEHGFRLVEIPVATIDERQRQVESIITADAAGRVTG